MKINSQNYLSSRCSCGNVRIETTGNPIICVACYCDDCQTAGYALEERCGLGSLLESDGGTQMLLYRRDHVKIKAGEERLTPYKISESSPTSRFFASCCNTPMFLDFTKGHWLTHYRKRFEGDVPPLELRVCTKFKPKDAVLADDVPNVPSRSFQLLMKLIGAKLAMIFGVA